MISIKPGIRTFFYIAAGFLCLLVGFLLFPRSLFSGFVELIPIIFSGGFFIFGLALIYNFLGYEITIDKSGISSGGLLNRKKISEEEIEGYFLTKEEDRKNGEIHILTLVLKSGKKKQFDSLTLGAHYFEILKNEIKGNYEKLRKEKVQHVKDEKAKRFVYGSYVWAFVFLIGCFLSFKSFNRTFDFLDITGTLAQKPEISLNKRERPNRVTFKLNEFPDHKFSQVKTSAQFLYWANHSRINDTVTVEISITSFHKKMLFTEPLDQVIINYDNETLEVQRLRNLNGNYVYKENRTEEIMIPICFMVIGFIGFFYYRNKK